MFAAWWVGRVIQPRDANERAIKELARGFCGELLGSLAQLSEIVDKCPTGQPIPETVRHELMRSLTGFSNTLAIIDEAVEQWGKTTQFASFQELRKTRDDLRTLILDPLVTTAVSPFETTHIRQIHGEISKGKRAIVRFQLQLIKAR
jgi:hypothetical protein